MPAFFSDWRSHEFEFSLGLHLSGNKIMIWITQLSLDLENYVYIFSITRILTWFHHASDWHPTDLQILSTVNFKPLALNTKVLRTIRFNNRLNKTPLCNCISECPSTRLKNPQLQSTPPDTHIQAAQTCILVYTRTHLLIKIPRKHA